MRRVAVNSGRTPKCCVCEGRRPRRARQEVDDAHVFEEADRLLDEHQHNGARREDREGRAGKEESINRRFPDPAHGPPAFSFFRRDEPSSRDCGRAHSLPL